MGIAASQLWDLAQLLDVPLAISSLSREQTGQVQTFLESIVPYGQWHPKTQVDDLDYSPFPRIQSLDESKMIA